MLSLSSVERIVESGRSMPKRPCALAITSDNKTILCADKFGDVFALPLLGQTYEVQKLVEHEEQKEKPEVQPFALKANHLTVHTKRNRDALRQQLVLQQKKPEAKATTFEYRLVLGHVSLLTDLLCASLPCSGRKDREYIITCDRDEHIRISRGLPQAHVIEGFCLGHTSFITKLCLIPSFPSLLVSGGGDDEIFLWDWPSGRTIQRLALRRKVDSYRQSKSTDISNQKSRRPGFDAPNSPNTQDQIAVNGIVQFEPPQKLRQSSKSQLFVTVEGQVSPMCQEAMLT